MKISTLKTHILVNQNIITKNMTPFNFKLRAKSSAVFLLRTAKWFKLLRFFILSNIKLSLWSQMVTPAPTTTTFLPQISRVSSLSKPLQYNLKQSLVTKSFDADEGGGDEASKGWEGERGVLTITEEAERIEEREWKNRSFCIFLQYIKKQGRLEFYIWGAKTLNTKNLVVYFFRPIE